MIELKGLLLDSENTNRVSKNMTDVKLGGGFRNPKE